MSEQSQISYESANGSSEGATWMPPEIQALDEPYQTTWLDLNTQYTEGVERGETDPLDIEDYGGGPRSFDNPDNLVPYVDHLTALRALAAHRKL